MRMARAKTRRTLSAGAILFSWIGPLNAAPDLNGGAWRAIDPPQTLRTVDGKEPPLLPAAKARYKQNVRAGSKGDRSFDVTERCLPPGLPRLSYMPGAFEFLQRPEQIAILYEWGRLVRLVYMDVPQPELIGPAHLGQSVGRWEAGALVVDSIGFTDMTTLDASGLPHSEALHLTERFEMSADGQLMTVEITIDDPGAYSAPWRAMLRFRRDPAAKIREDFCLERQGIHWGKWKEGR